MFDEDNSGAIDFLEFIELLQRVPRVSQYSTGFKHLALSSPSVSSQFSYRVSGRPFGKQFEIRVFNADTDELLYEHIFDSRLRCTRKSIYKGQIVFLLADKESTKTEICVLNLQQLVIQTIYRSDIYYDKMFIGEKFFFLGQRSTAQGDKLGKTINQSAKRGRYLAIDFDDLAGKEFYLMIEKLEQKEKAVEREHVTYKRGLEDKVIYPYMINITHVYSLYRAHKALKDCLVYNVPFTLSTDNKSALSICVKQNYAHLQLVDDILARTIENAEIGEISEMTSPMPFREQCRIQSHLRPTQY